MKNCDHQNSSKKNRKYFIFLLVFVFLGAFVIPSPAISGISCGPLFSKDNNALRSQITSKESLPRYEKIDGRENPSPYAFENGHNKPLQAIMAKIWIYNLDINEFLSNLNMKKHQGSLRDLDPFRMTEDLNSSLEKLEKYQKLFDYLAKNAHEKMMTPRIEMKDSSLHKEFIQKYIEAYQEYIELLLELRSELESWKKLELEDWNIQQARNIMMEMHDLMGRSHNRF